MLADAVRQSSRGFADLQEPPWLLFCGHVAERRCGVCFTPRLNLVQMHRSEQGRVDGCRHPAPSWKVSACERLARPQLLTEPRAPRHHPSAEGAPRALRVVQGRPLRVHIRPGSGCSVLRQQGRLRGHTLGLCFPPLKPGSWVRESAQGRRKWGSLSSTTQGPPRHPGSSANLIGEADTTVASSRPMKCRAAHDRPGGVPLFLCTGLRHTWRCSPPHPFPQRKESELNGVRWRDP